MHWVGRVNYCAFISICICIINGEIIFMRLCLTSCHFMSSFYTAWKHQRNRFFDVSRGIEEISGMKLVKKVFSFSISWTGLQGEVAWKIIKKDSNERWQINISSRAGQSQPAITCSKLEIETLEQGVKYVWS